MALWQPWQMVSDDQSAANERTVWHKYGWPLRGVEGVEVVSVRRSERWSILTVYMYTGRLPEALMALVSVT